MSSVNTIVSWVEFYTFMPYEIRELSKKLPDAPFEDIAFLFRKDSDPRRDTIEISANYPLEANGHSRTRSYNWDPFYSYTWDLMTSFAKETFPDLKLDKIRFWINPRYRDKKVDVTVDF